MDLFKKLEFKAIKVDKLMNFFEVEIGNGERDEDLKLSKTTGFRKTDENFNDIIMFLKYVEERKITSSGKFEVPQHRYDLYKNLYWDFFPNRKNDNDRSKISIREFIYYDKNGNMENVDIKHINVEKLEKEISKKNEDEFKKEDKISYKDIIPGTTYISRKNKKELIYLGTVKFDGDKDKKHCYIELSKGWEYEKECFETTCGLEETTKHRKFKHSILLTCYLDRRNDEWFVYNNSYFKYIIVKNKVPLAKHKQPKNFFKDYKQEDWNMINECFNTTQDVIQGIFDFWYWEHHAKHYLTPDLNSLWHKSLKNCKIFWEKEYKNAIKKKN